MEQKIQTISLINKEARVLSTSRHHLSISPDGQSILQGVTSSKASEATVGDMVDYSMDKDSVFIQNIHPRKNVLSRVYRDEEKLIVSNLDHLFIVSATGSLFNTLSIDKISALAHSQDIPFSLIINKIDLGTELCESCLAYYQKIGVNLIQMSAKFGQGFTSFKDFLSDSKLLVVALVGLSGVGKTTILNRLIPGLERETKEVSAKTGQGKQTTSQAHGFLYQRINAPSLLVVDLPGAQQFGVSHLSRTYVQESMPDILGLSPQCEYSDCAHIAEPNCAVKEALAKGDIASFRYESYIHMIKEIKNAREY